MARRYPSGLSPRWQRVVIVTTCVGLLTVLSATAAWAFSAETIGSANIFSAGTLQLQGQTPDGLDCFSTGSGSGGSVMNNVATCPGDPLPSNELSSTSVSSATTTLSSIGTTAGSTASLGSTSCGVEEVADSTSNTNTGLLYGGVTYGTPFVSPVQSSFTSSAISFDGNTGSYVGTVSQLTAPQTFSIVAWVNTTSTKGGSIIGFTNQQANAGSTYDRMLWVDNSGYVVFGLLSGGYAKEVRSTVKVNDGGWHLVVATSSSFNMYLYVDNQNGVSTYASSGQNYTGYWHLGWSPHSYWSDSPTDDYLNGSLAEVAVLGTALSSANVNTLYNASSASSYQTSLQSFSPSAYWQLNDAGTTPYTGTIPALGSITPVLSDITGSNNTATAHGAVTLGASGPLGTNAISLNGSTGTYVQTSTSFANPGPLTQLIWFDAPTSGAAGSLMGFTNLQSDATPSSWDRQLWIDSSGHLVYGVYPGSIQEVSSPNTYNDGHWHLAVASVGSAGEQLWVDGTEVASNSAVTSAQNYSGYWHLGYSNARYNWPDGPTSNYWNGSLAQAAVLPTQLTSAQITSLWEASTDATFKSDLLGLHPTSYWPLEDSPSSICGRIRVDIQATTGGAASCLYPASASACNSTPPSTALLSAVGMLTMPVPQGSSVSILLRAMLSASSPSGVVGLHVLVNLQFAVYESSWAAQLDYAPASTET